MKKQNHLSFIKEWGDEVMKLPGAKIENGRIEVLVNGDKLVYYPGASIVYYNDGFKQFMKHDVFLTKIGLADRLKPSKNEEDLFNQFGLFSGI